MFAGTTFAGISFGGLLAAKRRIVARRGIGGSGFPPDWVGLSEEALAAEKRRKERERERELVELMMAGLV
jgi:hypothetical protein